ncbi:MAG: DNA repair protein RadA, partial [Bacteroidia bacterium]|nr:DNA repair protein RadA [Bacteroidia bacterium]
MIASKAKTSYFCQSCGAQAAKWAGKCNSCGEWNTLVEEVIHKESKNDRLQLFSSSKNDKGQSNKSVLLQEIGIADYPRIPVPG